MQQQQPLPAHPAVILQRLISEECDEVTARDLERHAGVLVNATESAVRTPVGEAGLREFLRFVGGLRSRVAEERSAREYAEWHNEALRRQLHAEREGRNSDGFRLALGSMGQSQALQEERHMRSTLEAQLRSLDSRLAYSAGQHQRQALELQMMTRSYAEAEVEMEERLRLEVQRQQDMAREGQQRALDYLRGQCEQKVREARQAEAAARVEVERERAAAGACREDAARLDNGLGPWRTLQAARVPAVIDLVRFLREEGPEIVDQPLPARAKVPVMALEWPPHTELDTSLVWRNFDERGVFALIHGLCAGEVEVESLELTACCVEGRWLGALHGDTEAPRLAALMAFQALRPDVSVVATCRVVPMKRALLPRGVLELDPACRSCAPVGPGRVRGGRAGPAWNVGLHPRPAPAPAADSDEARLRALLQGCPLERELLSALCYVRAAQPGALGRPPPPPSALPPHLVAVA